MPDAVWSARSTRVLQATEVACEGIAARRGATVLDGVDLTVPFGARLLLVSEPAGAATLLVRILAGLARPASGTIRLAGVASARREATGWGRRVTYVGPEPSIFPWMTADEVLRLSAQLLGLGPNRTRVRIADAVEGWALADQRHRPTGRAGLAYTQRVAMAAALLGDPEVLLLDEPLRALPPDERRALLRSIEVHTTLVLASRYPASEAGVVDQVALIASGRVRLHAGVDRLEEYGLPLSHGGLAALAAHLEGSRRTRAALGSASPASA